MFNNYQGETELKETELLSLASIWSFPHNLVEWELTRRGRIAIEKKGCGGTSLAVQWLRPCASTAGYVGSIPDQGTKIPHATE